MGLGRFAVATAIAVVVGALSGSATASSFKIIYTFKGGDDGSEPAGPLVAIGGILYGVTNWGGSGCGCGTVFSLTSAGRKKILYSFKGKDDGADPYGLIRAGDAVVGLSLLNDGTWRIFSVTTDGKHTSLGAVAYPAWQPDRRGLTQLGDTWYGVDIGSNVTDCTTNRQCGYVFAIQP